MIFLQHKKKFEMKDVLSTRKEEEAEQKGMTDRANRQGASATHTSRLKGSSKKCWPEMVLKLSLEEM